jgi:DNA-binding transcriptional MocR family regulator
MSQSIDLASGHPSPALIPIQDIQKSANNALSNPVIWQQGINYGPDGGYMPLRQNLSRWLASFYASDRGKIEKPDVERICVTGGASQNLASILQVYTDPVQTKRIFVVEPAYFLSFRVFEDAGFGGRLKGIPEDKEGINLGILEDALKQEVHIPSHEGKSPKVCRAKQKYDKASNTLPCSYMHSNNQNLTENCTPM